MAASGKDVLGGAHEAPGKPSVNGDVASPDLRELEIGIGDVQLIARSAGAGCGGLVGIRVRVERKRRCVVDDSLAGEYPGVAKLIRNPDVRRPPAEDPGPAA